MKVAVTTNNSDSRSEVASTFARAPWVLVYDTESKTWESHQNPGSAETAHGAGTQAVEFISRLGVDALISSACGPNAFRALSAAGIKAFVGSGRTAEEAMRDYEAGRLRQLAEANGPGR